MTPFVIFSLPRSRSAWLSTVLCASGRLVGHDLGINSKTPEDFVNQLQSRGGTCETGASFAWRAIQRVVGDVRFAVVLRDPREVNASLEALGLFGYLPEMEKRFQQLLEIAKQPNVFVCDFHDLENSSVVADLYRHCTQVEPTLSWIDKLQEVNIQVDIFDRVKNLIENASQVADLKQQIIESETGLKITVEPWSDVLWSEIEPYAAAHYNEVDGGVESNRPFKVDKNIMSIMNDSGTQIIIVARNNGNFVGYFTWQILPDVESEGLLIANQGAWYVKPNSPRVAYRLFDKSVEILKQRGVKCIFPHHRTQGRGANIGKFFKRRGARLIQHTYSLWIGDN